jgi:hypothetical protein
MATTDPNQVTSFALVQRFVQSCAIGRALLKRFHVGGVDAAVFFHGGSQKA